jgi:PKHD-type hydroxylase
VKQNGKQKQLKTSIGMVDRKSYVIEFEKPFFSSSQLRDLIATVDANSQTAKLISTKDEEAASRLRRSRLVWLAKQDHPELYKTISNIAREANRIYDYDIKAFHGPLQVAVYDSSDEGFFDWHTDTVPTDMSRKISISIPLNKESDYEGGDFEVREGNVERKVPQLAGFPLAFPSWLPHRVTPVISGRRYSMVAWVLGPYWR